MRNSNAVTHGLRSRNPALRVPVAANVGLVEMAGFASDLADAAQWVARELAEQLDVMHSDARLIGLYAAVAGELAQTVGEFLGETGIKPASLGRLDDAAFEAMMAKEAEALALILSQTKSAFHHLRDQEELGGSRPDVFGSGSGLLVHHPDKGWRTNPMLNYLAAYMRAAKRLMRDMAANQAWKQRGLEADDDLAGRLIAEINRKERG
jgi:hypothetical protein